MNADALREHLLKLWMETEPSELVAYGSRYWRTAERNGVWLFTRPAKVMERPAPHAPYREVDGVAYIFVREDGKWTWDFDPANPTGQGMKATIAHLAEKHAVTDDEILAAMA